MEYIFTSWLVSSLINQCDYSENDADLLRSIVRTYYCQRSMDTKCRVKPFHTMLHQCLFPFHTTLLTTDTFPYIIAFRGHPSKKFLRPLLIRVLWKMNRDILCAIVSSSVIFFGTTLPINPFFTRRTRYFFSFFFFFVGEGRHSLTKLSPFFSSSRFHSPHTHTYIHLSVGIRTMACVKKTEKLLAYFPQHDSHIHIHSLFHSHTHLEDHETKVKEAEVVSTVWKINHLFTTNVTIGHKWLSMSNWCLHRYLFSLSFF